MSNDFVQPKISKKVMFLKQIFLAPKMQRLNSFLKFIFLFFGKTGKKKIIFTKSILDIFIFVHFEKVDPSFVFTFLCRGLICSKRVPTFCREAKKNAKIHVGIHKYFNYFVSTPEKLALFILRQLLVPKVRKCQLFQYKNVVERFHTIDFVQISQESPILVEFTTYKPHQTTRLA